MSRELRFRIWDKDSSKMYIQTFGGLIYSKHTGTSLVFEFENVQGKKRSTACSDDEDETVIMRFTGLKDKNGVPIYDRDILENPAYPNHSWERCLVKYHDELARFGLNFYSEYGGEGYTGLTENISEYIKNGCYVIGNEFENPELL